jgi:two-component system, sensor histidine kinase
MAPSAGLSTDLARTVLDATRDAVLVIDSTGTVVYCNRQVSALFGYRQSELVGQAAGRLLPERFRDPERSSCEPFFDSAQRAIGGGPDLYALRKNGEEFPVDIALRPLYADGRALVAASIGDASEHSLLKARIDATRASAERANRAKSRFIATASHELRQPLQSLTLVNGTLRRMVADPAVQAALAHQDRSIAAMSRLVNALLDISKLESGAIKPEITDFRVAALLDELRAEFAEPAADKGLQLEILPSDELVHSDSVLLGQVLRNLVSNAIKYTRQGLVQLKCLHHHAFVHIDVLDTGIGIPADQLGAIYDEYYQIGVPANATRDGYGLGLSIVQRVVQLLDLKLDVTSVPGKGSTFSLQVPSSRQDWAGDATRRSHSGVARLAEGRQPHVLLVEDDAAVRDATRMLLQVAGYRVTATASVAEAEEEACRIWPLDVLVADYHLGSTDTGMDAIIAARNTHGANLKAILVTGDTSPLVQEFACDANTRVAGKPINADEFLSLLAALQG